MSQPDPTLELEALADDLRRLSPREACLDRDALLFRAGQASARGWLWPATAALASLTALAFGVVLAVRPPTQVVEVRTRVVLIERPAAPASIDLPVAEEGSVEAPAPEELPPHRRLQEHLLRWGLDGLGPSAPGPANPKVHLDSFSHYSDLFKGESLP